MSIYVYLLFKYMKIFYKILINIKYMLWQNQKVGHLQ